MINEVRLIGWIGHDLKLQNTTNGDPVINFDLSTTEIYIDPKEKKKKTITDWHKVVAYGRLAENLAKYAKKGSLLYIEGKHKSGRKWTAKDGAVHHVSEIAVREFKLMPAAGKGKGDEAGLEGDAQHAAA